MGEVLRGSGWEFELVIPLVIDGWYKIWKISNPTHPLEFPILVIQHHALGSCGRR